MPRIKMNEIAINCASHLIFNEDYLLHYCKKSTLDNNRAANISGEEKYLYYAVDTTISKLIPTSNGNTVIVKYDELAQFAANLLGKTAIFFLSFNIINV